MVLLGLEIITNSPLSMHVFRLGGPGFDLLPQTSDMHVHRTLVAGVIIAPDQLKELFSRIYLVGMEGKKLKDVKFPGCEIDFFTGNENPAALGIQRKVAGCNLGFSLFRLSGPG